MNGPEHYVESERLLEAAKTDLREGAERGEGGAMLATRQDRAHIAIAAAGVHARLALAAATALANPGGVTPHGHAWADATSPLAVSR